MMPAATTSAAMHPRRLATAAAAALLALVSLLPLRDVPLVSHSPTVRLFDPAAVAVVLAAGNWLVLSSRRYALATGPVLTFCVFYAVLCLIWAAGDRDGLGRHGGSDVAPVTVDRWCDKLPPPTAHRV